MTLTEASMAVYAVFVSVFIYRELGWKDGWKDIWAITRETALLWPLAQHAGVDLIHFGIIFTVNLAIVT